MTSMGNLIRKSDGSPGAIALGALFTNGTAMFFDNEGLQINHLQHYMWRGLKEFVVLYPDAPIFMACYREWSHEISREHVQELIEMLEQPRQER